jgi:hypothetical protein
MADPIGAVSVVKQRQFLGGASLLLVCTVGACTKVRQQSDPLPARPLPSIARTEPTRRAWPVSPSSAPLPPDAAPPVVIDTLNGDPKGLKREDINNALQQALPTLAGCFQGSGGPPSIGLTFDAEPDGRASNIKVSGATPVAERCVSASLARVKLPVFEGKSVPVSFPITVYSPPVPKPTAAVEQAVPAAVPVAGAAAVPPPPPPGTSTAPYVPSSMPATAGSAPSATEVKTFIQP